MNNIIQHPPKSFTDAIFTIESLIEVLEDISAWHLLDEKHGERTSAMATKIAMRLEPKFTPEQLILLDYAARIHDLGRIAVDDAIMTKTGPLTTSERGAVEAHVVIGHRFLVRSGLPQEIMETIYSHHEKYDGSGYPLRLEREAIPVFARIVTIADMYDALISNRPYRKGMTSEAALNVMNANITWFDPYFYSVFLQVVRDEEHPDERNVPHDERIT